VQFDLDLKRLPAIKARPQQLSAVFSALLHSAGQATGDGGGSVQVATRCLNSEVEVTIHDHGKELPPGELALAFSPAFRVREGRMVAANWNLFGSREMIRHQGGDIVIRNAPGQGTTVLVTLPC
jgi:signal transduction histidine kinase